MPFSDEEIERREKALQDKIDALENRIETILEERDEWTGQKIKKETEAAFQKLENLEANATTGMENLSAQLKEMRDTLTQISQEKPLDQKTKEPSTEPDQLSNPPVETPPEEPPEPQSVDADGPQEAENQKKKNKKRYRVI